MAKQPATIEASAILDAATPDPHKQYSVVFRNEQGNRLHAFSSGIDALEGEKVSHITAYETATEKRRHEYEEAQAKADADHLDQVAGLNRRIADLSMGADMARAAMEIYDRHNSEGGDAT